jgi:hypothetical protein
MPRRVEDIIRNDRRTVRDIPLEREPKRIPIQKPSARMRVTPPPPPEPPRRKKASKGGRARKIGFGVFLAIVVLVAGTAYIASTYFSRATFTIVPVTVPVSVSGTTVIATGTSTPGNLRYEVIRYSGSASTTIPATDGTNISTKATGSVTLFNYYSPTGQRLIAGTRFAAENGLIYRLPSSVFIPATKGSSPGTIKATLVADQAGSQYNMARNDGGIALSIIAYKGSPRYDTVYAKAYSGMTGGFAGTKKIVDQRLLASTTKTIQDALTKSLQSQALARVPEGYVTYPAAYGTSFAPTDVGGADPKRATVTVSGTYYSIVFKKTELAAKLAGEQSVDRFGKSPYSITGLEGMTFSIANPSSFSVTKMNALIAKFTGNMVLTGVIPVDALKAKLAGLSLADTRTVFASYGSVIDISKSSGELFPSWSGAVPKDQDRISIVIKD